MAAGRLPQKTMAITSVLVLLAILTFVNLISEKKFWRKDMTRDQIFTVSEPTRRLVEQLNDEINVKLYIPKDIPAALRPKARFVTEMARELAGMSKGKLRFQELEPPTDDKGKEQLKKLYNIEPQIVQVAEKGKAQQQVLYYDMLIQHRDKFHVLSFPEETQFEYDFTRALLKLTQEKKPILKFFCNDPKYKVENLLRLLNQAGLDDLFDVRSDLMDKGEQRALNIPKDTALLVIAKPQDMTDAQLYSVDQYVMDGGKLLVLAESTDIGDPLARFSYSDNRFNFYQMLDHWGIKVEAKLVEDYGSHGAVPVRQTRGAFVIQGEAPYALFPIIQSENFLAQKDMFKGIRQLIFPYSSEVAFAPKMIDGVTTETILTTTEQASVQTYPFDLQVSKDGKLKVPEKTERHTVMAMAKGKFPSYFAGKDAPTPPAEDRNNASMMLYEKDNGNRPRRDVGEKEAEVMVIGSARAFDLEFLMSVPPILAQSNFTMLQNLFEHMVLKNDLIGIRARNISIPLLKADISESDRLAARLMGVVMVPALIGLLGVAYLFFRKAQLRKTAEVFSA